MYLPERTAMMQAWADYLDKLKAGTEIIPIRAQFGGRALNSGLCQEPPFASDAGCADTGSNEVLFKRVSCKTPDNINSVFII